MKDVILVALPNHPTLSNNPQLGLIPYRTNVTVDGEYYHVVRHTGPQDRVLFGQLDANWDFEITYNSDCVKWRGIIGELPGRDKKLQAIAINDAGHGVSGFMPLVSYSDGNAPYDLSRAHLIKPCGGARGIGQIYIPAGISVNAILDTFKLSSSWEELQASHPMLELNTHRDSVPNEGFNKLKNEPFFVQEVIAGELAEFRLLISVTNNKVYCGVGPRIREGSVYRQATGRFSSVNEIRPIWGGATVLEALTKASENYSTIKAWLPEIAGFIENLRMTYGSLDIFVKLDKQGDPRRWGAFEYSTEFSYTSFDPIGVAEMTKQWYLDQVRQFISHRESLRNGN